MGKDRKKKAILIVTGIIIAVIIAGIFIYNSLKSPSSKKIEDNSSFECKTSEDCVPSSCCHPNSCVAKAQAPDCKKAICTQSCEPETLDCNQAFCSCISNKCKVVQR